jgi:hypothetical protein
VIFFMGISERFEGLNVNCHSDAVTVQIEGIEK